MGMKGTFKSHISFNRALIADVTLRTIFEIFLTECLNPHHNTTKCGPFGETIWY